MRIQLRSGLALLAGSLTGLLLSASATAKVATMSVVDMTASADRIILARVEEVQKFDGLPVAKATPLKTLKGSSHQEPIFFVAGATWSCDVSTAVQGETAMLFLTPAPSGSIGRSRLNKQRPAEVPLKPLYMLSASGRGRWPVSMKEGRALVTVPEDVRLPSPTGSKARQRSQRERIPLAELEKLISAAQHQGAK